MWLTLIFLYYSIGFSATHSVPLDTSILPPAGDLVFEGDRISRYRASQLIESGVDISALEPHNSNLYRATKLSTDASIKVQLSNAKFIGAKTSSNEVYKFSAVSEGTLYTMQLSLQNNMNIVRARLLRLMGYAVQVPVLRKQITVDFESKEQKEKFLEDLSDQTLTSRDRWIVQQSTNSLTLRHILISPGQLTNVPVYQPVMVESRQQSRRLFRGLLALYGVTDLPEGINNIPWSYGSVFNQNILLTHRFANAFPNMDIYDLKWMLRKLIRINRRELADAVSKTLYPQITHSLIVEKLIARINHLARLVGISPLIKANISLNTKYIKQGKLTKKEFKDTALNYGTKDEQSPYRAGELFRLFGSQSFYQALSSFFDSGLARVLPGISSSEARVENTRKFEEFKRSNPGGQNLPLKLYSEPIANGRVFFSRSIIFGRVLDTVAPINLVDTVGAELNLGTSGLLAKGHTNLVPNVGVNLAVIRSYSHIQPMADLKSATSEKLKNIYTPRLMKSFGAVIKTKFTCSIKKDYFVEDKTIDDVLFKIIKYDTTKKTEAMELRAQLVAQGFPADKIVLTPINKTALCSEEINELKKQSIEKFVKNFGEGETFLISDTLRISANASVPFTLAPGLSVNSGMDKGKLLLRSTLIRKRDEEFIITFTNQNNDTTQFSTGLNFVIQLLGETHQFSKGKQRISNYTIPLNETSDEQVYANALNLRRLLVSHDKESISSNYNNKLAKSEIAAQLNTLKLLWFKRERFRMGHELAVSIPVGEKIETRNFYQYYDYKRKGQDYNGILNNLLSNFASWASIGTASPDPGSTFLGQSSKVFVGSEAEMKKDAQIVTKVELISSGWSNKVKKIKGKIDQVNALFSRIDGYTPLNSSIINGGSKLKSYELRTTIIIYPQAMKKILRLFSESSSERRTRIFQYLKANDQKSSYKKMQRLVEQLISDKLEIKQRVEKTNLFLRHLFNRMDPARVLEQLGTDNFFATTRLSGFLEDSSQGQLSHSFNSVGTYNTNLKTGIIDSIATGLGINAYQLRALSYSPGM